MGLEKLVEEVQRKANTEAANILERAKAEAAGIIANIEGEARLIVESAKKEAMDAASKEAREKLSEAKSRASRVIDFARAEVVNQHLQAVWAQVLQFRQSADYRKMLSSLVAKAAADLGKGCKIYVREEDARLIEPYAAVNFIDGAGGLLAEDSTGRIKLDGRLETLFAECADRLSAVIYSEIFPGGR